MYCGFSNLDRIYLEADISRSSGNKEFKESYIDFLSTELTSGSKGALRSECDPALVLHLGRFDRELVSVAVLYDLVRCF